MPVYIPQYQHDIFVSYAHIDNAVLPGAEKGWVTTLIDALKILLAQQLGSSDAYSLWINAQLSGNTSITSNTFNQLEQSATFLVILSPAYLESQQCRSELEAFLAKFGSDSGRVFIVERDVITEIPYELSDLLGYQFWVRDDTGKTRILATPEPRKNEPEYYQIVTDLSFQLADKLKTLKQQTKATPIPIPHSTITTNFTQLPPTTVFLANVTDDLEQHRLEVKRYLDQLGVRVLPEKMYSVTNLQQSLDMDLNESCLFVQLLSDKSDTFNYPQFQYERAKAAKLPIMQWRDPALKLHNINDSKHQALLEAATVIATELVDFQEEIFKQLQPKKEKTPYSQHKTASWLVFVNAAPEDLALATQIQEILDTPDIGYILPMEISTDTSPASIREDLEQNLLYCDAVIIPYDKTPLTKIRQYLMLCRRMLAKREHPLKVLAVCDKPSPIKPALNMKLPNMQHLECHQLQAETGLAKFIRILRT